MRRQSRKDIAAGRMAAGFPFSEIGREARSPPDNETRSSQACGDNNVLGETHSIAYEPGFGHRIILLF